MHHKLAILLLSVVLLTGVAAAKPQPSQLNYQDATEKNTDTIKQSSVQKQTVFSFLFSFLRSSKSVYEEGEVAEFSLSVDMVQSSQTADIVYELNKCDPSVPRPELTRDDCNDNQVFDVLITKPVSRGETYTATVRQVLSFGTGNFEVVAYAIDPTLDDDGEDNDFDGTVDEADETIVSEAPHKFVTVVEATDDGGVDSDGDGVNDANDLCPNQAGEKANGCPEDVNQDLDDDSVNNIEDVCPREAGPQTNNGCPIQMDADKDGVSNQNDACPKTPGSKRNGCPNLLERFIQIFFPNFFLG